MDATRTRANIAALIEAAEAAQDVEPATATAPAKRGIMRLVHDGAFSPDMADAVEQLADHLQYAGLTTDSRSTYQSHARSLLRWITWRRATSPRALDYDGTHWTYAAVGGFCVAFVLAGCKASSLHGYLSAWRHIAKATGRTFTKATQTEIARLIKTLSKITDPGSVNYAMPWLYEMSLAYATRLLAAQRPVSLRDARFLAQAELRRGCCARAGTICASPAEQAVGHFRLTKAQVVWSLPAAPLSVGIDLPPGKSAARRVYFAPVPSNPLTSTYALIRRWYDASGMASPAIPGSAPFFPALGPESTIDWTREQGRDHFVRQAKAVASLLGLSAEWVAAIRGHSFRSGGATDLLSRGVPDEHVQLIGGWRSACFRLYQRITPSMLAAWSAVPQNAASYPIMPQYFLRNSIPRGTVSAIPFGAAFTAASTGTHQPHGPTDFASQRSLQVFESFHATHG